MFHIFGSVRALMKIQSVQIDNNVFRLHYQMTVFALLLFSILVVSRQYFGDPIDCTVSTKEISNVIDNYCWMHSHLPDLNSDLVKLESHPAHEHFERKGTIDQHYYQWVGSILFFQAFLFFIPRYLWKHCWEEGKIKGLAGGLKGPVVAHDTEMERRKMIVYYFQKNMGHHNFYFFKYVLCEILNFTNIVLQMVVLNKYLDLMNFSWKYFDLSPETTRVYFPKVVKCQFNSFSSGGGLKETVELCVLPVNIFNEKIFAYMWIWFIILASLTALSLHYRMLTLIPSVRVFMLLRKTRGVNQNVLRAFVRKNGIGDWFLLYQIGKNVNSYVFGEILKDVCNLELENRNSSLKNSHSTSNCYNAV